MAYRQIGHSINEAIDWTQDMMCSTRPIAEAILFSLLREKKIIEGNDGFVLLEDDDDDDVEKNVKVRKHMNLAKQVYHRPRFTFGHRRRGFTERQSMLKHRLQAMGYSDEAEEMHYGKRKPHDADTRLPIARIKLPTGWVI